MFRLAGFDDEKKDENGLYRYLSTAVSQTIITCLDGFLEDTERCRLFCDAFFGKEFFAGLSVYIKPKHSCSSHAEADEEASYEFLCSKMARMKEKMEDQEEFYTFDVFEERVLFLMCIVMEKRDRTAAGRKAREPLKKKVEEAKSELRAKYGLTARTANDYARKMYYASAMLLKDDEDDNLIFWDDDYLFFWKDGFLKGIHYLKELPGTNAGYGYDYTCEIFSDIGIKPPLMLLGTEEANRIVTEMQNEQYQNLMDGFFEKITDAESIAEVQRKLMENEDNLPFT